MKITDKIYKIIVVLVIAGIAIPFVSALGASPIDTATPSGSNPSEVTRLGLPEVRVVDVAISDTVKVVDLKTQKCEFSNSFDHSLVQGQSINLYQPLDCYKLTKVSASITPQIRLAKIDESSRVVIAKKTEKFSSINLKPGQPSFPTEVSVTASQIELKQYKFENFSNVADRLIIAQQDQNISEQYKYKEFKIFRC